MLHIDQDVVLCTVSIVYHSTCCMPLSVSQTKITHPHLLLSAPCGLSLNQLKVVIKVIKFVIYYDLDLLSAPQIKGSVLLQIF